MSDQLYDEWSAACDKVRELDLENTELRKRISALEEDKALLIKDLRETWDYGDEHIEEVLKKSTINKAALDDVTGYI